MTEYEATVDELIELAHERARSKGFWDGMDAIDDAHLGAGGLHPAAVQSLRDSIICQKLALISIEVRDFEQAALEKSAAEATEELADYVIRAFDLAAYLGGMLLSPNLFTEEKVSNRVYSELAHLMYQETAEAVRFYRHDSMLVMGGCFDEAIQAAADYAFTYFGTGALRRKVERKIRINEARPYLHGKRY